MIRGLVMLAAVGVLGASATLTGQPTSGEPAPKQDAKPNIPSGHPQIPMPKVGTDWPQAKPEDVESIDAILKAFYQAPAGGPNQPRDWDRYRSLFVPSARMIPARTGEGGAAGAYFLQIGEYIDANRTYFEKGGFFDTEIARRSESFGNIVHVWSSYESRRKSEDSAPYIRGINSIQLLKDGGRYWIINVFWDYERPDNPIPEQYLPAPK
jgi:hypothetical protein